MEQQRKVPKGLGPVIGAGNQPITVKREAGAASMGVKAEQEVSSASQRAPSDLESGKNFNTDFA